MTMIEKKCESIKKEIEKLTKSLDRYTGILEKKNAKCAALDCEWTREEFYAHRDTDMSNAQYAAWFEKEIAEDNVADTKHRLENACKRLEKAEIERAAAAERTAEQEAITAKEIAWLEAAQASEEKYLKWLEEFKADCAKDGVLIEEAEHNYVRGLTKTGKRFILYINNGWTERSFHSYTLRINGNTVFTSGLFSTCYGYIVNR